MSEAATLVKNLQSNGINISAAAGRLQIDAPKGIFSEQIKEQLRAYKSEIIEYLKILAVRDFCAVCRARLSELPNGEWKCPTDGCTDARVKREKERL